MLLQMTKDLWLWCMERNISIHAQHLPGVLNTIADRESRTWSDRSEWKLPPAIFHRVNLQLGPLSTDLFASRLLAQLTTFVSWKPHPSAIATDAFTLDWSTMQGKLYANPPQNMIGRVLSQVCQQSVHELVLVAPVRRAQAWYPTLLQMLVRVSLLIPNLQRQYNWCVRTTFQTSFLNQPYWLYPGEMPPQPAFKASCRPYPIIMDRQVFKVL